MPLFNPPAADLVSVSADIANLQSDLATLDAEVNVLYDDVSFSLTIPEFVADGTVTIPVVEGIPGVFLTGTFRSAVEPLSTLGTIIGKFVTVTPADRSDAVSLEATSAAFTPANGGAFTSTGLFFQITCDDADALAGTMMTISGTYQRT